jgi:HD superfamily phosphohydrolase
MGNAFDILYPKMIYEVSSNIPDVNEIGSDSLFRNSFKIGVRIGALLHDVGHVTLSHWLEELIKEWAEEQQKDRSSIDECRIFKDHEELGYCLSKHVILPDFYQTVREQSEKQQSLNSSYICFIAESMLYPPRKLKQEVCSEYGFFTFENMLRCYTEVILRELSRSYGVDLEKDGGRILRALAFPFYQLLQCWVFTLDEVDYLTRDNLTAGTEFGQIDWMRLLNCTYVRYSEEAESLYLNIDSRKLQHSLKLFYESYFHSYTFVYGHPVVKYFDKLASSLVESLPGLKKYFKDLLTKVSKLFGELQQTSTLPASVALGLEEELEKLSRTGKEIELFTRLSELVDATFVQKIIEEYIKIIEEYIKSVREIIRGTKAITSGEQEKEIKSKKESLDRLILYISRIPNYKILCRLIALPREVEVLNQRDNAHNVWREFIEGLNKTLDKKLKDMNTESDSFILYDWGIRLSRGINFLPFDTTIDHDNDKMNFKDFLGKIAEEFRGYCFWIALLYLKKIN